MGTSSAVTVETVRRLAVPLTPGVIDDNAIEAFTLGQCATLALALHDRTGWPLWVVVESSTEWLALNEETVVIRAAGSGRPIPHRYLSNLWSHVVVERPDGKFVDITGARDRDTLLAHYDDLRGDAVNLLYSESRHRIVPSDRASVANLHSVAKRSHGVAELFVDAVLALADVEAEPWPYEQALRSHLAALVRDAHRQAEPGEVEGWIRESLEDLDRDHDMLIEAFRRDLLPAELVPMAAELLTAHELISA